MANENVNKVIINNQTLIDLTGDTVTADKLSQGYTAHDASGQVITGTLIPISGEVDLYANATEPSDVEDNSLWVDYSDDVAYQCSATGFYYKPHTIVQSGLTNPQTMWRGCSELVTFESYAVTTYPNYAFYDCPKLQFLGLYGFKWGGMDKFNSSVHINEIQLGAIGSPATLTGGDGREFRSGTIDHITLYTDMEGTRDEILGSITWWSGVKDKIVAICTVRSSVTGEEIL